MIYVKHIYSFPHTKDYISIIKYIFIMSISNISTPPVHVTIPKIIMQTWKNDQVPEKWQPSVTSIQTYMPSWSHILMTDEDNLNFVKKYFPDFLPYFVNFPYNIQRADAIRAMILYVFGGIYMDLDIEILKPLDELFTSDDDLFFVKSGNVGSYVTNSFMASKPRNPFWLTYLNEMKLQPPSWALTKHFVVMTTTGPMAMTRALEKNNTPYYSLPTKLMMPCSVCDISRCDISQAYVRPLEGQSWNGMDSLVLNYFMCNWKKIVFIILLIIIIIIIIILYLRNKNT